MGNVKLFNQGSRTIFGKGFELKPKKGMAFDTATAANLQRLYPNEVISMEDVQRQFEENTSDPLPSKPAPTLGSQPSPPKRETKPAPVTTRPVEKKPESKGKNGLNAEELAELEALEKAEYEGLAANKPAA
jgi:hypothetical protein